MGTRYETDIPHAAVERVTATHMSGERARAEYVLEGEVVGRRFWDEDGRLALETPLKDGVKHGVECHWYFNGALTSAEPYFEGQMHGTARQWDDDGQLIGTYEMVYGTGVDLWRCVCEDGSVSLAEIRYYKDGDRHGFEWWLRGDTCALWKEGHFKAGQPHGIEREWNLHGRLCRGFPKYFMNGVQLSKNRYLTACKHDPTLPPFRAEENSPARTFPPEIQRELHPTEETDCS